MPSLGQHSPTSLRVQGTKCSNAIQTASSGNSNFSRISLVGLGSGEGRNSPHNPIVARSKSSCNQLASVAKDVFCDGLPPSSGDLRYAEFIGRLQRFQNKNRSITARPPL